MPLRRRPFVPMRASSAPSKAVTVTGSVKVMGDRSVRMLPPVALRNHNQMCMFEKICVVTTFLDEAAEDASAEQSSAKDAGAAQRRRTGSAEGVDGADGAGGSGGSTKRASLADGTGPVSPDGEASSLAPADRGRSQRRSSLGSGQHGGTSGGGLGETGSLTPGGTRGSLPLVAPRTPSQPNSLGSAGRRTGQGRSKCSTNSSAAWNQTWRGPGAEELGSAERTKRVMQALCKQFYQGTPQVERHVFSGDERPCTPTSASGANGTAAGGPAPPSTNAAAAAAPSGTAGAEGTIGAEDVLDANPPTSARTMDGETE